MSKCSEHGHAWERLGALEICRRKRCGTVRVEGPLRARPNTIRNSNDTGGCCVRVVDGWSVFIDPMRDLAVVTSPDGRPFAVSLAVAAVSLARVGLGDG